MEPPVGAPALGGVVVWNKMVDWAGRTQAEVSSKAEAIYSCFFKTHHSFILFCDAGLRGDLQRDGV